MLGWANWRILENLKEPSEAGGKQEKHGKISFLSSKPI